MSATVDLSPIEEGLPPIVNTDMQFKLSIWHKLGPIKRLVAEGDWVHLPNTTLAEQESIIKMSCDILILQLPDKLHVVHFTGESDE